VIDVCAEFFLSELSSTVPIVTPDIIRQATAAAANDDEAYCFCCSFCASVLLQTDELSRDQLIQAGIHQEPRVLGQTLLTEALLARGHLDLLASIPSLRTVFLTFFIYGCHSALGKHRQAWYFLREATTFYTTATMDLAEEDIDEAFHRLFWLLLVSERFDSPMTVHALLIASTIDHMQSAGVGPLPCKSRLNARDSKIWRETVLI
jgi:alpha-glucosidase